MTQHHGHPWQGYLWPPQLPGEGGGGTAQGIYSKESTILAQVMVGSMPGATVAGFPFFRCPPGGHIGDSGTRILSGPCVLSRSRLAHRLRRCSGEAYLARPGLVPGSLWTGPGRGRARTAASRAAGMLMLLAARDSPWPPRTPTPPRQLQPGAA